MATTRSQKSPRDHTGRKREQLQAEREETEKTTAASVVAEEQAEAEYFANTVVDYTDSEHPVEMDVATAQNAIDAEELVVVEDDEESEEVLPTTIVVRAVVDVHATIGYGNRYDLVAGRQYRVPLAVAQHLDEKGVIYPLR